MTDRRRNVSGNGGQIPRRVENAAQFMSNANSYGPRRGYVPPQTQGQWQPPAGNQPSGYYPNPPYQQPYPYNGQSQMNGSQRGYFVPPVQAERPPKKQGKKTHHLLFAVIAVILLVSALGAGGYFSVTSYVHNKTIREKVEPYDNLFCPGVYVDGISLGGMTPEQARNSVESQIQQRNDAWKVQLFYNGTQVDEINAEMLNFNVDAISVLYQAWAQGHTGDNEQRYADMIRLEQEPYYTYTAQPDGDTSVIDRRIALIKKAIDTEAADATMTFDYTQSYPFVFTDEVYGRILDAESLKSSLYRMVSMMEAGAVDLTGLITTVEPTVKKADLQNTCALRGEATTVIDRHSPEERNKNIIRAFEFVNGVVLEPGQTFSFNKTVGERTIERGFFEAIEYVSRDHVTGVGGGVCQASTTIFQAALKSGLTVTKRSYHSDKVSYADYGLDATVYWDRKDLVFRNNTDGKIYITAVVERDPESKRKNGLRTRVDIYGLDRGDVRYELQSEITETIINTQKPEYRKDTTGEYVTYKDQTYTLHEARNGMKVNVYRIEYTGAFETNRELLYTDTYDPQAEVILRGIKDR